MLRLLASGGGRPWSIRRLATRLGIRSGSPAAKALRRLLSELEQEGLAERFEGHVRGLRGDGLVEGRLRFVAGEAVVEDAVGRVRLVPDAEGAEAGDTVLIAPDGVNGGEVVQVLSAEAGRVVGRLHVDGGRASVEPFGHGGQGARTGPKEWRVGREDRGDARDGDVVEGAPRSRGRSRSPQSWLRVTRRLGRPGEPEADFGALVWRHRLPVAFPPEVAREATRAARRVDFPGERLDLTELLFVTIDPASARDHDDAVCVEDAKGGVLRLWVAIADVSHFVESGGALDREAMRRGNSIYLPDRAIPMLPEVLSSGACSLVEGEERLVLACELEVGREGQIRAARVHRAVIRSRARLAYEEAASIMDGDGDASALTEPLRRLAEVARRLRERRYAEGTLDLDLPEASLRFDEAGWPIDSVRAQRTVAHRAIEEAMLAANRAVADWLVSRGVPAVHRLHEPPGEEALETLAKLLARFGLLGDEAVSLDVAQLARALGRASGRPAERAVHWLTLRSMQKARYSADETGHYALGFEQYLHFTSPIRRVADLAVHRAIHRALDGKAPRADALDQARRVALRASVRERVAQQVERDARAIKQAALMEQHLGDSFEGRVSGFSRDGVFVSLEGPVVDGRVEMTRLGRGLELAPDGLSVADPRSRLQLRLGDTIRVRVESVDAFRGHVAFGPADAR